MFRLSPGFTFTAVAALALGIGANTAIFSVVNAVLLQPLPYPHPERIVQILGRANGGAFRFTSIPRFNAFRAQSQVFDDVTAYDWRGGAGINLTGGDRPEQVPGEHVSFEYFRLFGAGFVAGRAFTSVEDRPGSGRFVILSSGLWQRHFGADRSLVGKSLLLGGDPYTVVGIVTPAFAPDPPVDLWLPLQADPNSSDQATFLNAAARLKPGVTLDQANAALQLAAQEFRRKFPAAMGPAASFTAEPLRQNMTGDVRPALLVLLAAVACVLFIACANVANLLLARGASLGAHPSHLRNLIVGQPMTLAVTGILIGLAAAFALTRLMASMLFGVKATDPVVFTCVAVSMWIVAVFASLLPARRSGRIDPIVALRHE